MLGEKSDATGVSLYPVRNYVILAKKSDAKKRCKQKS
jgi:hypothetical protein